MPFDDSGRNIFGLVNPDTNDTTRYAPPQPSRKGLRISHAYEGDVLVIDIESEKPQKRAVYGVFDLPYESGVTTTADKEDARIYPVTDRFTQNTHLGIDLGKLPSGKTRVKIALSGEPRTPVNAEDLTDLFGAMWFGDHAYLRSMDLHTGLSVTIDAPDTAYLVRQDGVRIHPENGSLRFTVNTAWHDEAPILYGYPREAFKAALTHAVIEATGESKSRRWSW